MKTIIANWKMNVGVRESVALARGTLLLLRGRKFLPQTIICPSFIALSDVKKVVARSAVQLGAQTVSHESEGAYTGEVSARMLTELGVSHVIIGHSERRQQFRETDEMINKKMVQALSNHLIPILCVGEQATDREMHQEKNIVKQQLKYVLASIRLKSSDQFMIAYEPVWAIGTGVVAQLTDVLLMHEWIRLTLKEIFPSEESASFSIVYGGSVEGVNAYPFLREQEIDGLLVGGASLKLHQLKEIIEAASSVIEAQTL